MSKRAVIFDFGGVIFKTRDYTPRHRWDERLNQPHGTVEQVVHGSPSWLAAQRGEMPVVDYWADVALQLCIAPATAAGELARDFYSGDVMDAAIVDVIRALRANGHTVALLSNDCAPLLRPRIEALGISDLFDPLVISSEIGVMKPDEAAYTAVLARMGRAADETVFVDDRQENVLAANVLGIHGVHYHDGMDLVATLQQFLGK